METALGILFLLMLVAFIGIIGIIICIDCDNKNKLEDAETKAQSEEIANKFKICYQDMIIKELEDEIKKLKKGEKNNDIQ